MTRRMMAAAAMLLMATAGQAIAHDGHDHTIMGTVTARDDRHLEVKTPSGEVLSIAVSAATKTTRARKPAAFKEVQVGRRVVVNIGNGEDPMIAREIQVGVPAAHAPARR